MGIPSNLSSLIIIDAIQYIKQNGVPDKHKSTKYDLIAQSGEKFLNT